MLNIVFVCIVFTALVILLLIPTGFEQTKNGKNTLRTVGIVTETDESGVVQHSMIKTGDQGVTVEITRGRFKGETVHSNNILIGKLELDKYFRPGDKVLVGLQLNDTGQEIVFANVIDKYRINIELFLFALFVVFLIVYAGWTGLKAVLSFAFTGVMIWKVIIPSFLKGYNPVFLSLGVVVLLTGAIIFLIGGLSKKGVVAFFGAISGVLVTCILSLIFGDAFRIHGAVKPFSETLLYSGFGHLDLTAIFLSGIFIASSGAVMDIAMDISASMNEIHEKHPETPRGELIRSGFNVGRAVVGTMTTTLLLAYSGGYTALLMVFMAQGTPMINIFNLTYVSAEILHTMVGSFGLVLVAPLTALIGGLLYVPYNPSENAVTEKQLEKRLLKNEYFQVTHR